MCAAHVYMDIFYMAKMHTTLLNLGTCSMCNLFISTLKLTENSTQTRSYRYHAPFNNFIQALVSIMLEPTV